MRPPRMGILDMWTWMAPLGFLAMFKQFIPRMWRNEFRRKVKNVVQRFWPYVVCDVHEFSNFQRNPLFRDVQLYLSSTKVEGADHLNLSKDGGSKELTYAMASEQQTLDIFEGVEMEWVFNSIERSRPMFGEGFDYQTDEKRYYSLQLRRKDKDRLLDKYMRHIESEAKKYRRTVRPLQLYTNSKSSGFYISRRKSGPWQSVPFLHPARFETIAMDGGLKSRLLADLDQFAANENYYKRVGKAWKRGYLLFGPPGTGKSSMVAAIANKMRYDVYDLELTEVNSNTELRKLLLETTNKSIVVIEDIDCSLDLSGQRKKKKKVPQPVPPPGAPPQPPRPKEEQKVTLSGLLNFVDGLWSSCGSERIFIFTTNFVEKLDPALLRPGRMDQHLHLGYCTFSAFQTLAKTYLEITEHELFDKLENAFAGTFMTPAAVGEVMITNQREDVSVILERLIEALGEHKVDPATIKSPETDEEEEDEVQPKVPQNATKPPPPPPKSSKKNKPKTSSNDAPVEDKEAIAVSSAPATAPSGESEDGKDGPTEEESSEEAPVDEKESITVASSESANGKVTQDLEIGMEDEKPPRITTTSKGTKAESKDADVEKKLPVADGEPETELLVTSESKEDEVKKNVLLANGESQSESPVTSGSKEDGVERSVPLANGISEREPSLAAELDGDDVPKTASLTNKDQGPKSSVVPDSNDDGIEKNVPLPNGEQERESSMVSESNEEDVEKSVPFANGEQEHESSVASKGQTKEVTADTRKEIAVS